MPKDSTIFRDRSKLSPRYVPERLPHREEQIQNLLSLYRDALEQLNNSFLQTTQIIGGVGTGKTCTAQEQDLRRATEGAGSRPQT